MGSSAVGNLKGGVGKTTVTVNLAVALVRRRRKRKRDARVLVVDMDTQAFATALLTGRNPRETKATVATMLAGLTTWDETVIRLEDQPWLDDTARAAWKGIDLLPSNPDAKITVAGVEDYWALRENLQEWRHQDVFWTLFDCGHGDTDSFNMAIAAADGVLGVTAGAEGGLLGLLELRRKLQKLHRSFPHVHDLTGVIANNFDLRRGPDRDILQNLHQQLGHQLWEPLLPSRVAVERAHGARLPLAALNEVGAQELTSMYDQLARKLITTEAPKS